MQKGNWWDDDDDETKIQVDYVLRWKIEKKRGLVEMECRRRVFWVMDEEEM